MTSTLETPADLGAAVLTRPAGREVFGRSADRWQQRYAAGLALGDVVTSLALVLTVGAVATDNRLNNLGMGLLVGAVPAWAFFLFTAKAYDRTCIGLGTEEFRRVGTAGMRMLALVAVVGFGFRLGIPRSLVAVVIPGAVLLSWAQRAIARRLIHRARAAGRAQHVTVVVGRPDAALQLVHRLQEEAKGAFRIARACASEHVAVEDILTALRETGADTVAVASDSGLSTSELRRLGWALEGSAIDLIVTTDLVEVAGPRIHVRPVAGLPLLHVERPEISGLGRIAKGAFDRSAALMALVVFSPLIAAIGLAIRLTSEGGAMFRQTRVGKDGREFTVLKFRTMRVGADAEVAALAAHNESDGPLFKMKNDPRITSVGAKLRRLSLDELPQLWNVVRGDMSLVGPRPPLPSEVATYETDVHRRLLVKPGLTGLWQVSGRSDLTWDQSVRLDLNYVENWSFTTDLAILFRTVGAVLASRGAY